MLKGNNGIMFSNIQNKIAILENALAQSININQQLYMSILKLNNLEKRVEKLEKGSGRSSNSSHNEENNEDYAEEDGNNYEIDIKQIQNALKQSKMQDQASLFGKQSQPRVLGSSTRKTIDN